MVSSTDARYSSAEASAGSGIGGAPLGNRGTAGPGWRIPPPRTAEVRTSASGPVARPHALTDRDRELVQHLADGRSTAQIAAALAVSSNTARTRIRRIAGKLAVTGRRDVVRAARVHGLV